MMIPTREKLFVNRKKIAFFNHLTIRARCICFPGNGCTLDGRVCLAHIGLPAAICLHQSISPDDPKQDVRTQCRYILPPKLQPPPHNSGTMTGTRRSVLDRMNLTNRESSYVDEPVWRGRGRNKMDFKMVEADVNCHS